MNREQAIARLAEMSLEDCIKMWNESDERLHRKNETIHETEDDKWWENLYSEYGAHYLVYDIAGSVKERTFCPYDNYFFYNGDNCRLYSFTDKEELMKILEPWFIDELVCRK
jgi:hypothetical protein